MKMKIKTFMMLGLMTFIASMTFVSCSDSDDSVAAQSSNNQISVIADVQNTITRATPITSANYPSLMKDFYASATSTSSTGINYFFKKEVFTNNGKGVFRPASPYYWQNDELTFVALSPASSDITLEYPGPGAEHFIYTTPTDQSKQLDIMVAYGKGSKKTNNGAVSLTFKHVLSQVRFAATSASNISAMIKSIKIHNIMNKVDGSYSNGVLKASYANDAVRTTYGIGLSSVKSIDGSSKVALYDNNGILLLSPQNQSAADFEGHGVKGETQGTGIASTGYVYLEIECSIYDKVHKKYMLGSPTTYGTTYVPVAVNWVSGKCYTYVINFTGDGGFGYDPDGNPTSPSIKLNVNVENWQNADDITSNI